MYQKIIEEVVQASMNDFEESGVGQGTLNELQQVSYPRSSAGDFAWPHVSGRGQERRHISSVTVAKKRLRGKIMATILLLSRSQLGDAAGRRKQADASRAAAGLKE